MQHESMHLAWRFAKEGVRKLLLQTWQEAYGSYDTPPRTVLVYEKDMVQTRSSNLTPPRSPAIASRPDISSTM